MTALVLKTFISRPALAQRLRTLLARLARTIDSLVSARAAREVPEWRMREVEAEINRYQDTIRSVKCRHDQGPKL